MIHRAAPVILGCLVLLLFPCQAQEAEREYTPTGAVHRIGNARFRQATPILHIRSLPDQVHAISAGAGTSMRVWDLATGSPVHTTSAHTDDILAFFLSRDGSIAVTGGKDNAVRVYDLSDPTSPITQTVFGGLGSDILSVARPDHGKWVAAGCFDASILILDPENHKDVVADLRGHSHAVRCLAVAPDGSRLVSGSLDDELRVWDVKNQTTALRFKKHKRDVLDVILNEDGSEAISVDAGGEVIRWNTGNGEVLFQAKTSSEALSAISWSRDRKSILTGGASGNVYRLNPKDGSVLDTFEDLHNGWIWGLDPLADGSGFISTASDKTLRITNNDGSERAGPGDGHEDGITCMLWDGKKKQLFTGSLDGTVRVWQMPGATPVRTIDAHSTGVMSLGLHPGGAYLITGGRDARIAVWNRENGEEIARQRWHEQVVRAIEFVDADRWISVSGNEYILTSGWNENDPISGYLDGEMFGGFRMLPGGRFVLFEDYDHAIQKLELGSREVPLRMIGHTSRVRDIELHPDGEHVLSAGSDGSVRYWDLESGRLIRTLRGHRGKVYSVSIHPEGRWVLSGGSGQTIILWDLSTGREIRRFLGHSGSVTSVEWTGPTRFVSGSLDRTALIWQTAPIPRASFREQVKKVAEKEPSEQRAAVRALLNALTIPGNDAEAAREKLVALGELAVREIGVWFDEYGEPSGEIRSLIQKLSAPQLEVRNDAMDKLRGYGVVAMPFLSAVVESDKSHPEAQWRAAELLDEVRESVPKGKHLVRLGAVDTLEWIGSVAARKKLKSLSEGLHGDWVTEAARNALQRLERK